VCLSSARLQGHDVKVSAAACIFGRESQPRRRDAKYCTTSQSPGMYGEEKEAAPARLPHSTVAAGTMNRQKRRRGKIGHPCRRPCEAAKCACVSSTIGSGHRRCIPGGELVRRHRVEEVVHHFQCRCLVVDNDADSATLGNRKEH